MGEKQGFFERLIASGFAFGPQGAQFGHIPLNGAVDALLVESEKQEIVVLGEPSAGLDEGIFDEKLGWVFRCCHAGIAGIEAEQALPAGGEDAGFDGAGTLEAPAVFSNGLGDIDFEGADGGEGFADAFVLGAARNGAIFGGIRRRRRSQAAEPPALADPWARTR